MPEFYAQIYAQCAPLSPYLGRITLLQPIETTPRRSTGWVCKTSIRGFESHPRLHYFPAISANLRENCRMKVSMPGGFPG